MIFIESPLLLFVQWFIYNDNVVSISLIACYLTTNDQQQLMSSILIQVVVEPGHVIKYGALFNFGKGIVTAIFGLRL